MERTFGADSDVAPEPVVARGNVEAKTLADPSITDETSPPSSGVTARELLLAALALCAAAVVTFGLLNAGSFRSSDATAAELTRVPPPSPDAGRPAVIRTWSAANRETWVGTQRNAVAYEVEADDTVATWTRTVRPSLVVRCVGGSTEIFVFTQTASKIEPQTEGHTVTLGFDDGEAETERWLDSADHDALFAPDGRALAQRLSEVRTLRFGFTPHNAMPASTTFQVAGLEQALAPATRECGWKK